MSPEVHLICALLRADVQFITAGCTEDVAQRRATRFVNRIIANAKRQVDQVLLKMGEAKWGPKDTDDEATKSSKPKQHKKDQAEVAGGGGDGAGATSVSILTCPIISHVCAVLKASSGDWADQRCD